MKKVITGTFLALTLFMTSLPAYAADSQIKIDGVAVSSDAKPETKNNRIMVPLRIISENLGAKVNWSNSEVTLTKNKMKVMLKPNSKSAVKNDEALQMDVEPYVKDDRMFVPLRFIAETFGCKVNYSGSTVTVDTAPLAIEGVKVKALQQEYRMTMGGVVQQVSGNAYHEAIYHLFTENKGAKAEAPAKYAWNADIDTPGSYYKNAQYDFLDEKGNSVKRFDLYSLLNAFPSELLEGYPAALLHDATEDQWYLFNDAAVKSIGQLVDTAARNGFLKVIINTVV
ncbi:copper amine oxidase N-terminal domain-containing protein [Cohnella boryungensis]|uniref:Copper amine oxidase N-terminal domain-containing protein n=1 Tax=Cohnella boryungensis TaxID=768479 RepID=A0ABV8SJV1_9BACL